MRAFGTTALILLLLPTAAMAADPGVQLDPRSPAGKEYGIPLDQARSGATGNQQDPPGGAAGTPAAAGAAAPAFGAGISARSKGKGARAKGRASSRKPQTAGASAPAAGNSPLRVAASRAGDPGGSSSVILIALLAVGVVGVGAAGGFAASRFGRTT
jgi:hypothetical protein